MFKNLDRILAIGAVFLLFLVSGASAQVNVLTKPVSGGVEMSEVSQYGGYVQNFFRVTGVQPDYYAYRVLPMPGSTGIYSGSALASKGLVSGAIGIAPSYGVTLRGGSRANSAMDIFADVVPESKVRVKINASMSINWVGPIMDNRVGFGFDALAGEDKGDGLNRAPLIVTGGLSRSTLCVSAVSPPASSVHEENGKTYYKLGTISLDGVGGIESPNNLAVSADYNVRIGDISAYYIGSALTIIDGNLQTWIVGNPLPKALVVKVADGETGELVSGVPITFTIQDPANGVKFPGGQTSVTDVTESGLAAANLTLGSAAGNYTIKATCPASVCTSGAKEVVFTETAVTENTVTELREVFCDGTYFAGQTLPYPLRVKAYNKLTGRPREGLVVTFSKVPLDKGDLSVTEAQTTGPNAIARASLTLGPIASGIKREQYTITATCADCLANTTVTCPVEAVPVPDKVNPQTDLELFQEANGVAMSVLPNVVAPKDAGGSPEASVTIQSTPNTDFTASIYTVPFSGGHQHNVDRPVGTWKEQSAAPQNVYKGKTDATGKAVLTYVAGIVGGEERIEVVTSDGKRGQKFVFVRVTGLGPLPRSSDYKWHSGDSEHPNYWYASQDSARQFSEIARKYKTDQKVTLRFNDLSLISGGILDSRKNWTSPHLSHRKGTGADVNSNGLADVGVNPQISLLELDKIINGLNKSGTTNCCRIKEKDTTKIHIECPKPGVADPIPLTCTESTK